MKFHIKFVGRQVGAIGVFSEFTQEIEASSEREAILKLYEKFEHIRILSILLDLK